VEVATTGTDASQAIINPGGIASAGSITT